MGPDGVSAGRPAARTAPLVGWVLVGVWCVLGLLLYTADRRRPFHEGGFVEVDITLVRRDARGLACALEATPFGFACGYDGAGRRRELPAERQLQPCVTLKRDVLLVPGLFANGAIRGSIERDPEGGTRRITAHCTVRLLSRVQGARLRFVEAEAFGRPDEAWLASLVGCRVSNGS